MTRVMGRRRVAGPADRPGVGARIGVTLGDPAGIGPEVVVKALTRSSRSAGVEVLVVGSSRELARVARVLQVDLPQQVVPPGEAVRWGGADLLVWDTEGATWQEEPWGRPGRGAGRALDHVEEAVRLVTTGVLDALVTAPINKAAAQVAGRSGFQGHTEFLQRLVDAPAVAMLLVAERLRVALVTRHIPLQAVPARVTQEEIVTVSRLTADALQQWFGIASPRLGVLSVNPHGGEQGRVGGEEQRVIAPAVSRLQADGMAVTGPLTADWAFPAALAGRYDALVAMYHDQALIPLRLLGAAGVNLTAGLPFLRTAPLHGTAYEIAGRGVAEAAAMEQAIDVAARLSRCRPRRAG